MWLILALLLLIFALTAFLPVKVEDTSVSNTATSHDEAIVRVETIRTQEESSGELNPVCLWYTR
jgi:cell division septal protein FtsQ